MKKSVFLVLLFLVLIPAVHSITLKDLINFFNFNFFTNQINVTYSNDIMVDRDNNSLNDTLMIELATSGNAGNYLFIVSLFDENAIINETNKTLSSGINRFNISFSTELLSKNKLNYSIRIYENNYSLKYSKENIETQFYGNYESGLNIINISDSPIGNNSLQLNLTINFTKNDMYEITAYLGYNNSLIFSKTNVTIDSGISNVLMNFSNATIKSTHYAGNFNLTNIKINNKIIKTNYTTNFYDYRDFAKTSYLIGFSDSAIDTNSNRLHDLLMINASMDIKEDAVYKIDIALYDLFDNFLAQTNISKDFSAGRNNLSLSINGTEIYGKKLNGPFMIKYAKLIGSDMIADQSSGYATQAYNYTDFEKPGLPDINLTIKISDGYHYGETNVTINISVKNIGTKPAFNSFFEFFDNSTYSENISINILEKDDLKIYTIGLKNISDMEFTAIADFDDFVEELDENNNIIHETIKVNKKPELKSINNITANETDLIKIEANAADNNSDALIYAMNDSRFSKINNTFSWKTSTMDSGNYTVAINVSDGFLHDYSVFNVVVLDKIELDSDNDGINDTLDRVIGNPELINTSTINVSFFIGNSSNISKEFDGMEKIEFKENNLAIVEFDFNFTNSTINFSNIMINKQNGNSTGALIFNIRNATLPKGFTKTIYMDKLNISKNGICIRDKEVLSMEEISANCDSANEFKVECDGTLQSNYNCTYTNSTQKYRISGLSNSGVMQIDFAKSTESSSSTPSGSNGGSGSRQVSFCLERWECVEWSECLNNLQTRACSDLSKCGTSFNKPLESRQCSKISIEERQKEIFIENQENIKDNIIEEIEEKKEISSLQSITGFSTALAKPSQKIGALVVFFTVLSGLSIYAILSRIK